MLPNIWDLLFGSATDDFGPSSENRMAQVIRNLSELPMPPIDSTFFKSVYAITWALGIILGLLTGWTSSVFILGKSQHDIGTVVPVAVRWSFFIRVAVFGFFAPPLTGMALYIADELADAANGLPDASQRLPNLIDFGDVIMSGFITIIEWFLGVVLEGETSLLNVAVLPVLALTPVFYGLSIAGKGGLGAWRFWVAALSLTVTAKPILAWVLALGNVFAAWLQSEEWDTTASWLALGTMAFAAALPFIMLGAYKKKVAPSVGPATVTDRSAASGASQYYDHGRSRRHGALLMGGAAGLNSIASRQASRTGQSAPRTPGDRRIAASNALRTGAGAISRTYPGAAIAGTVVSMGVGASGRRAKARGQAIPPQAHPAPPSRPRPPAEPPATSPRESAPASPRMRTAPRASGSTPEPPPRPPRAPRMSTNPPNTRRG